jgi:hypothetical protein
MADVEMVTLKKLKPRFVRQIKKQNPSKHLNDLKTRVCYKDLHAVLHNRIDDLLEADQTSFGMILSSNLN